MTDSTYSRIHIGCKQLETAINLLISNVDPFSAITLAGAADSIFIELVRRACKKDFANTVQEVSQQKGGNTPALEAIRSDMNKVLGINTVKHFDKKDSDPISLNAEESAVGAILKAMANLKLIQPNDPAYVKDMLLWCWKNLEDSKNLSKFTKLNKYITEMDQAGNNLLPKK